MRMRSVSTNTPRWASSVSSEACGGQYDVHHHLYQRICHGSRSTWQSVLVRWIVLGVLWLSRRVDCRKKREGCQENLEEWKVLYMPSGASGSGARSTIED